MTPIHINVNYYSFTNQRDRNFSPKFPLNTYSKLTHITHHVKTLLEGQCHEKLQQVFAHILKYHVNILLDFNVKLSRDENYKPTIGNESIREGSKDSGVIAVNFTTPRNLVVKSTMFPHRNIHKYTPGLLLMGKFSIRLITYID